jgi:hypothetical protein
VPNILIVVPGKKEKLPLSVTHPDLAKEADGWNPDKTTAASSKQQNWTCVRGHKWSARTSNRAINGTGCPVCAGKKVLPGKFDGYSEAWNKSTFEVKSIKELMKLTEEFEG